jgi:6,7-dimethyl-8-ribityllumazine synthase
MGNTPDTLLNTNNLQVAPSQVVVLYTEWNEEIISELVAGTKTIFDQHPQVSVSYIQVPGAVELPFAVKEHYELTRYRKPAQAYIVLGCVIKGDTQHFEYVCNAVTDGITWCNTHLNVPTIYGVLTVNNLQQAKDRIGGSHGHKGEEAAITALKMIAFKQKIMDDLKAK